MPPNAFAPQRSNWRDGCLHPAREGRIDPQIRRGSVSSNPEWARVFTEAGIPTEVESDMQSSLRSHAALVAPLMSTGTIAFARGAGLTWAESGAQAEALRAGVAIVRAAGNSIRPPVFGALLRFPRWLLGALLRALNRTRMLRDLGALGTADAYRYDAHGRAGAGGLLDRIRP